MKEERDFVRELLDSVSKRIGKPYKYLAPFEDELKKNWYDSPQALQNASDAEFQKMNIPLRVAIAIREELGVFQSVSKKQPARQKIEQASNQSVIKMNQQVEVNSKKLTQVSMLQSIAVLQDKMMKKYPWVGEQLKKVFQTLLKIIKNILGDPYELKFRVLKKSNAKIKEIIMDNQPVVFFLKEIGFEEDEGALTLQKFEIHQLYFLEEGLEAVVNNHGSQVSLQNKPNQISGSRIQQKSPFLPSNIKFPQSKQSTNLQNAFSKQQLQEANYAEILDKLIDYRNQLMARPPTDRQLKIYHKKYDVRQMEFQQCDIQKYMDTSDDSVLAGYWKNVLKNNRNNTKFQSRRKTQFQYLIKQKVYKETIIKVRLPNQLIIEARFGPLQTLRDVFNLVSTIIIGDIYLYQSPPVKRLDKQFYQNLQNLNSVPNGSFYLGINNEWYVKNQYVTLIRK